MRAIEQTQGAWIDVPDEAILEAMALLGRTEGIFGEPAGVASLAGVAAAVEQGVIRPEESVTVIMTGNGLKDPVNAQKTGRIRQLIKPNIDEVEQYIRKNGVK
jgi:threonine synthase